MQNLIHQIQKQVNIKDCKECQYLTLEKGKPSCTIPPSLPEDECQLVVLRFHS